MAEPSADPILARLMRLHPKKIDLTLGRIEALLADLDHPERKIPPTIHVAGTNGKGSTVAYLKAMYEAAGLSVHAYTSPHLVRFEERIVLNGTQISEEDLVSLLDEAERVNGERPITFFEITTAVAFLAFARHPADVLLLEVGLGGRLDATNVITPDVSIITPVSLDHTQFLGPDIPTIAGEKAGILKPGVPAAIGRQQPAGLEVIKACGASVGASLTVVDEDFSVARLEDGFRLSLGGEVLDLPQPGLIGDHQIDNAALAATALRLMGQKHPGLQVDASAMARGIASTTWPARLQRLTKGPMVDALPQGTELWLDGGHNEAAAEIIGAQLDVWAESETAASETALIAGMLETKDPVAFFRRLSGKAQQVVAIAIPEEQATLTAEQVSEAAQSAGLPVATAPSPAAALAQHLGRTPPPKRILICGSLYLAGRILRQNG